MSSSLISHFSFCTWANLSFRKTCFLILTYISYPGQAKMPDFSCILVKLIFTFFWEAFPSVQSPVSWAVRRMLPVTETSWLYISSWEEHCADGLKFGLFVLADHYLLYWLFKPCVYPGIIFERAAVVQQSSAQCVHSRGKPLPSVSRWKSCPCSLAAGLAAARSPCPAWFWSHILGCFE